MISNSEFANMVKENKLSEIDIAYIVDFAFYFVKNNLVENGKAKVKNHQLRRFFNAIKSIKIQVDNNDDFTQKEKIKIIMLKPQFANASAKEKRLTKLAIICNDMISKINDKDDFLVFANFFESIVAFHKPYDK